MTSTIQASKRSPHSLKTFPCYGRAESGKLFSTRVETIAADSVSTECVGVQSALGESQFGAQDTFFLSG